jgi:hypothetical protein
MSAKKVYFDTLRSLAFGDISATYAAIGTPFTEEVRILTIINDTAGDMIFSTDDTIVAGQIFVQAGVTRTFNFTSNLIPGKDDSFVVAKGTQFYVKQSTAPSSGAVYIENVYA